MFPAKMVVAHGYTMSDTVMFVSMKTNASSSPRQSHRGDGLFAGADASLQPRKQREVAHGHTGYREFSEMRRYGDGLQDVTSHGSRFSPRLHLWNFMDIQPLSAPKYGNMVVPNGFD